MAYPMALKLELHLRVCHKYWYNPHLADTDGDTLSDFVETGLDPNTDSTTAIDLLPREVGLTEQDLIDLRVGSKLASIANDQATLQVVIEQSDDLGSWSTL